MMISCSESLHDEAREEAASEEDSSESWLLARRVGQGQLLEDFRLWFERRFRIEKTLVWCLGGDGRESVGEGVEEEGCGGALKV